MVCSKIKNYAVVTLFILIYSRRKVRKKGQSTFPFPRGVAAGFSVSSVLSLVL